jgi:chemotaxis protein MotA
MVPVGVLKMMGNAAPAFGMVGTLIGLIVMLESMGDDASAMGMGLAVALVTTLYGVLLSRLVFLPAAAKAQQRNEIARFKNGLLAEGFVLLAEERSPQFIADRMNGYLDPQIRVERKKAGAA